MHCPVKRVIFGKHVFDICEEVYEPAEDSFLFAENLNIKKGACVLDVGTGSGMLGILAAEEAAAVIALDLNPYAIACAKKNSQLNGLGDKMAFVRSDLFGAFSSAAKFDLVLFNAPYLPSAENETQTWIGRSWAGGANGRVVIDRFIAEVGQHLKSGGQVLMMQSTLANVEESIGKFEKHHFKAAVKAEQKLPFFETLTLIEANKKI